MTNGRICRRFTMMVAAGLMLMSAACGSGGKASGGGGGGGGHIKGLVVKGRVGGATVTVYKVDAAGVRGASLGSAVSAGDGTFDVAIPPYVGALEVGAVGGVYIEESLGSSQALSGHELVTLIGEYTANTTVTTTVSPVSTLAAALARVHLGSGGVLKDAVSEAFTHLNSHFGAVDWRIVQPSDLTSAAVMSLDDEAKAGLVLAGLSQVAYAYAVDGGVTPGTSVSAATLTEALTSDAMGGGTLDGIGPLGVVRQASIALDGQTVRRKLGQAMLAFLNSSRNGSRVTAADAMGFATDIAGNSDPYLFCINQVSTPACAGGAIDLTGPAVTFLRPAANAGVQGNAVSVDVTATDSANIVELKFTAPAGLTGTADLTGGHTATLSGTVDVSAMSDGPLAIKVQAKDEYGNTSITTLDVVVANLAPTIVVQTPSSGGTIAGVTTVVATATPRTPGATITSLVVSGPAGLGADTDATAGRLSVAWDTQLSPEGVVPLTFEAVDSYGSRTTTTILPKVDNVPFGKVTVYLSAGAFVGGAMVTVTALDDATGAIRTDVGASGVLGTGGSTDQYGRYALTLSAENYAGPIQVSAVGPTGSPLQYIDPSDGVTVVTIPTSMPLTTIIPHYVTGTEIVVPITFWTTLADSELLAYVAGKHRLHPLTHTVVEAAAFGDAMFGGHFDPAPVPFDIRSTTPAVLTQPVTRSLTPDVFAAFPDVALNQLARAVGVYTGAGAGVTAPKIVLELQRDLAADGQFDGYREGGVQIAFGTTTPYRFDNQTMRVELANALDSFIVNTAVNKSGLTRAALDTGSGIYDQIALDASDLFVGAGIPFDSDGPAITTAATYNGGLAPVGGAVAGNLNLAVSALDNSGVASITVKRGGGTVSCPFSEPTTTSGACTVVFGTTVVADGPLSFDVTAVDKRGNQSTKTVTVTVDNTPPVITRAAPDVTKFYSDFVPVAATAADSTGVTSLTVSGLSGFVDLDTAAAALSGTWRTAGLVFPDGPVVATFAACDPLGNCTPAAGNTATINIDRTAPALAFLATPPATSKSTGPTFTVSATDPASVCKVWMSVDGGAPFQAQPLGPDWTKVVGVTDGTHVLDAWGEDCSIPANSGAGGSAPQKISYSWIVDTTPPAAVYDPAVTTYKDERGMAPVSVVTNGVEVAVLPAAYQYASSSKVAIPASGGAVYRAMSRFTWSSAPTAGEMESTNAQNVPFLQFSVDYQAGEATINPPVATVSYAGGVAADDVGVALWPAARTASGKRYFDLPLSGNLLPGVKTLTAPTVVTVSVSVSDSAGNNSAVPAVVSFTVHPLGGGVVVGSDTLYAGKKETSSTYYYTLNNLYSELFNASNPSWQSSAVRLQRYVLSNPESSPVAVSVEGVRAAWSMVESWTSFSNTQVSSTTTVCVQTPTPSGTTTTPPAPPVAVTAPTMAVGYAVAAGVETTNPSQKTPTGEFVVPAASGGQPGTIILYIARAANNRTGLTYSAARSRYEATGSALGTSTTYGAQYCCQYNAADQVCEVAGKDMTYRTYQYNYYLTAAADDAGSSFRVGTWGVSGGATVGERNATGAVIAIPQPTH